MCVPVCSVMSLQTPWMVGSPPGSSVHGIFQARILEWVTISYSRGSLQPRDRNCISCFFCFSCLCRQILYHRATWLSIWQAKKPSWESRPSQQPPEHNYLITCTHRLIITWGSSPQFMQNISINFYWVINNLTVRVQRRQDTAPRILWQCIYVYQIIIIYTLKIMQLCQL